MSYWIRVLHRFVVVVVEVVAYYFLSSPYEEPISFHRKPDFDECWSAKCDQQLYDLFRQQIDYLANMACEAVRKSLLTRGAQPTRKYCHRRQKKKWKPLPWDRSHHSTFASSSLYVDVNRRFKKNRTAHHIFSLWLPLPGTWYILSKLCLYRVWIGG